ncbi:kinase/pyrophosphorylase [Helcococcus kunzii]|uniref:PPDK regulatory protein n=1 Tax=Helcococcus kunzii ATCC 51366 TaxID=883114 RepID=H3NMJ3_9FIRM|nr:kinase/pyrophosphorylase [Helcococcus kunzii]EHR35027.1 hypothetical protein HMPREF9709_00554 [Helcococcus kunzii ATCC 51366]MCT1796755.1 kinase/pyrophosphorylase [Helcococcus kunzii]MCT1988857.1 kinase/pyrophosphorylase [Helcococcus kunzii]QUY64502.1 kinase/pyrophosphorylase [Helcococcus kunzii]QZO76915.1 kinase/pyrophosphorylase [Helcococcus kunzii]
MQNEKVWILLDRNSKSLGHILIKNYFMQEMQEEIKIYDSINTIEDLYNFDFYSTDQVIYYAFEDKIMSEYTKEKCRKLKIKYFDVYASVYNFLSSIFSKISKGGSIPNILAQTLENNPIEFTLNNDDGSNPQSIFESDIIIIGVSRTSKTPLSIYMSNLGYKVTNVPLVPEIELPKELLHVEPEKIIALTMDPARLIEIRKERIKSLGIPSDSGYATKERVLVELEYSHKVIQKLNCTQIDVTHLSIEEASEKIKNIIDSRKG